MLVLACVTAPVSLARRPGVRIVVYTSVPIYPRVLNYTHSLRLYIRTSIKVTPFSPLLFIIAGDGDNNRRRRKNRERNIDCVN